jgi:medium-chain acyl-[acyl-carrier-protein] hydrolase
MTPTRNPWLPLKLDDTSARLRLFCLPYAGGSSQIYRDWGRQLPAWVQVVPLQPPGRGSRLREPVMRDVRALAAAAAEAVAPLIDRPWVVFGHSLGAKVGFELVRLLARRHEAPVLRLFASASRAPQIPRRPPPTHDLPAAAFLAELGRLSGTPPEILADAGLMDLLMPVLRAEFAASQTYLDTGEDRLPCPVTALGGIDDEIGADDILAWRDRSAEGFDFRQLPGGHLFLQTQQAAVLDLVRRTLTQDLPAARRLAEPTGGR